MVFYDWYYTNLKTKRTQKRQHPPFHLVLVEHKLPLIEQTPSYSWVSLEYFAVNLSGQPKMY